MWPNKLPQLTGRNWQKEKATRRVSCLLVFILAMTIPTFSFGAEPQTKEGVGITKQQFMQSLLSVQQFKDQKQKEYEQFRQQLMETRKKELQEFEEKLKAAIPQDREQMRKQLEQKKTALREQTKQELEQKKKQLKAEEKQLLELRKKEIQEKMKRRFNDK